MSETLTDDQRAVLERAYWTLRDHAEEYRDTKRFREIRERWESSGRRDSEAGRQAAVHEFYARGIDEAARDIARMLGVPEHEIEEPAVTP